jgi:ABC-type uncharacterized transport system ATPase subunit
MAQVVLEKLCKAFGGVDAVKDASLIVEIESSWFWWGPRDAGKSTTLRMIAGLEEVTSGKILIGDRLVNDLPPRDRDIAMVFQNYALYPHMTVFDNMAFGLKMRKFARSEIEQRVREAAEVLGILDLLQRKPRNSPADNDSVSHWGAQLFVIHSFSVRRAAFQPRCSTQSSDADGAQALAREARVHGDLCHSRSSGGDDAGGSRRSHEGR